MRFGIVAGLVLLGSLVSATRTASAEPVALSIDVSTIRVEPEKPLEARSIELTPLRLPSFLCARRTDAPDPTLDEIELPEWLRMRGVSEHEALRLLGFGAPPSELVRLSDATPDIVAPFLEPVWHLADIVAAQANSILARGLSLALGDQAASHFPELIHGLAGDIQRGQYMRQDDVTAYRPFTFDLRLIVAWKANDRIRIEAGYAVAYLAGDTRNDFGATGPLGDRTSSNFLVHGPCASFNFDF